MIEKDSIIWAINFIRKHSDGDLFPRILEIDAIANKAEVLADILTKADLAQLEIGAYRRFIVPKDELSYRQATQLDLQDSIILTAIIYQYGEYIERRRLSSDIIFSYRFCPSNEGLYADGNRWNNFWRSAYRKGYNKIILYCDIADYYNQIYHHTIENQLIESGFPNQVTKWIIHLLGETTAGVSRGVPIGPHSVHLLAEASMIPIDNSLQTQGLDFIRYADDIVVFCNSEKEAHLALSKIASTLDRQQRLILQRHKTQIYNSEKFLSLCVKMIEDRPINEKEDAILKLVDKYSHGNPYRTIFYSEISDEDWCSISDSIISDIINEYLNQQTVEYNRLCWFYRRLTQIGHPGGIDITLSNIDKLTPCFSSVCAYLGSVQKINPFKWVDIGSKLLSLIQNDIVKTNEYFRLLLLSLFTKNQHINHFPVLVKEYQHSDAFIRREIILAAKQNNAFDWLREQKECFINMESWQQMAYMFSISGLPKEEREYFIKRNKFSRPLMQVLSKWSLEQ